MLKLIVNNISSINGNLLSPCLTGKPFPTDNSFVFDFQSFSPNLSIFRSKNSVHELSCEMTLEVKEVFVSLEDEGEEGGYFAPAVSCSFPAISLEKLNKKISFESYIQGILRRQFCLNILEQLLLFCHEKEAVKLVLNINDTELDHLEIYSRFFISEERIVTEQGERTQVIIPTDVHTYDEIIDFMDDLEKDFIKILWREQKTNPAFQEYLISHACA
jgi:hypothetical protein